MDHDLPKFRFANAVHSDVTLTLVFFNNCRLTAVRLVQFGLNIFISQIDTYIYNNYKHYK